MGGEKIVKAKVVSQKEIILKQNWDILIVIDACRYDYFKRYYKEILGDMGVLKKTISPSTWTFGWFMEVFGNKFWQNIICISTCPQISSERKKFKIRDLTKQGYQKFVGKKVFGKIIDLWKYGIDENIGVVHPKTVVETASKYINENPNKQVIVKFYQVHDPYIFRGDIKVKREDVINVQATEFFHGFFYTNLYLFLPHEIIWKIQKIFKRQIGATGEIWLKYGWEEIKKCYEEDLKLLLKYTKLLIENYPDKKIIVTTDHGERLGEKRRFGHGRKRDKVVVEVPLFEVNRKGKET